MSDVSFYDPRGEGRDDEKTMDFPLALMKTAQAVVQDGHKLFRFGCAAAIARTLPPSPEILLKFLAIAVSQAVSAIKCCLLVSSCGTLAMLHSLHQAKLACSTGLSVAAQQLHGRVAGRRMRAAPH